MQVKYWETYSGNCPVADDIEKQPAKLQQKIVWTIGLLEAVGMALEEPHLKKLRSGLYELRVRFSNLRYRILFVIKNGVAWLLHSFVKKDWAVPKHHIETALQRAAVIQ